MTYQDKQEWLRAVMRSSLTSATKNYAWAIFDHMYGNKTDSFPGRVALKDATGLNDAHFYRYNKALVDAGFMEVTARRGTSNVYRIIEGTATGGNQVPREEVGVPQEAVRGTASRGLKTTKKTVSKTSKEDINGADAPVQQGEIEVSLSPVSLPNRKDAVSLPQAVPALLADRTGAPHRKVKESQLSVVRRAGALTDMGIDLEGTW